MSDDFPDPLLNALAAAWPPSAWTDVTVLAAVSGGADSVALLRALVELKRRRPGPGRLIVAHFNHRLRGAESDADEAFVRDLAARCGCEREVGQAALAAEHAAGSGGEEAPRDARYEFLTAAADRHGARYVVTAHTADDQAETILHRIIRGTGLAGLAGMPRARRLSTATTLLRPLLTIRRAALREYLARLGQPAREDASNSNERFTRNRLRADLLPRLAADYNPRVVEAMLRLGSLADEAQGVIDELVATLAERVVRAESAERIVVARGPLASQPRYLVRELFVALWRRRNWPLQALGFAEWEMLADAALGIGAAVVTLPGAIAARRDGDSLTITRPGVS